MRVDVVGDHQVGRPVLGAHRRAELLVEERGHGRHAAFARGRADVDRRLDAQARDARGDDVLQQVAVVAGDFDHERLRRRGARRSMASSTKAFACCDPAVGERREVRVLGEGLLRRDQRRDLQQQAVLAQPQVQRVGRLGQVESSAVRNFSHGGVAPRSRTLSMPSEPQRRQCSSSRHRRLATPLRPSSGDDEITDHGPVLHVRQVEPNRFLPRQIGPATDLPQTGDARADQQPARTWSVVGLHLVAQRRPRPDDTHVLEQHVEELRELVDAVAAQQAADRRSPADPTRILNSTPPPSLRWTTSASRWSASTTMLRNLIIGNGLPSRPIRSAGRRLVRGYLQLHGDRGSEQQWRGASSTNSEKQTSKARF